MILRDRLAACGPILGIPRPASVTAHAVERLIERCCPGADPEVARGVLVEMLSDATFDGTNGVAVGQSRWLIGNVPIIVARDGAVLTVLPPREDIAWP